MKLSIKNLNKTLLIRVILFIGFAILLFMFVNSFNFKSDEQTESVKESPIESYIIIDGSDTIIITGRDMNIKYPNSFNYDERY